MYTQQDLDLALEWLKKLWLNNAIFHFFYLIVFTLWSIASLLFLILFSLIFLRKLGSFAVIICFFLFWFWAQIIAIRSYFFWKKATTVNEKDKFDRLVKHIFVLYQKDILEYENFNTLLWQIEEIFHIVSHSQKFKNKKKYYNMESQKKIITFVGIIMEICFVVLQKLQNCLRTKIIEQQKILQNALSEMEKMQKSVFAQQELRLKRQFEEFEKIKLLLK